MPSLDWRSMLRRYNEQMRPAEAESYSYCSALQRGVKRKPWY
jgi:hypothetical protein